MAIPTQERWEKDLEIRNICRSDNPKLLLNWIMDNTKYLNCPEHPNAKDKLLEFCVVSNKPKVLEKIIEMGLAPTDKTKSDLVIKASQYGCTKALVSLLKLGFDPCKEELNTNALSAACRAGHYGVVKTLLKVGAMPNTSTHREIILASMGKKHEALRLVLEKYPKGLLEKIINQTLRPASECNEKWMPSKTLHSCTQADILTKKVAEEIIKSASKSKIQEFLSKNENTLDI